ncbi:hypothetical protein [Sorangium sp. So ce854]|uniref:hypothetical protein n=1 Tax=Sorangium sp. So ce854 TaxID=3133322 RepID=UPI003F63BE04
MESGPPASLSSSVTPSSHSMARYGRPAPVIPCATYCTTPGSCSVTSASASLESRLRSRTLERCSTLSATAFPDSRPRAR